MHLMFIASFSVLLLLVESVTSEFYSATGISQIGHEARYHPILFQYQSQDKLGQYAYGYGTPTAVKSETTDNGITRGGYNYIDVNGNLQTVEYIVDPINGYRVAATNLPQDNPDVAFAKAQHLAEYEAIKENNARLAAATISQHSNALALTGVPFSQQTSESVTDLPEVAKARNEHLALLNAAYASAYRLAPPLQPVQDLPEVVKARAEHLMAVEQIKIRNAAIAQHIQLGNVAKVLDGGVVPIKTVNTYTTPSHAVAQTADISYSPVLSIGQDVTSPLGVYSYGYVGTHSSHSESRSEDGVTRGGYSYIDANGILQNVHYIADAIHGFRVAASNIPVDPNYSKKAI